MTEALSTPVFEDGPYDGVCSRCKKKRTFDGVVVYSDTGRIFAEGPCPVCGTKITKVLVA